QCVVQTGEEFGVRRELGLAAPAQSRNVGDAGLFLALEVPGLHAQTGAEEYDLPRVRRKLGQLRVRSVDSKDKLQRIARKNVDAAFILGQEVFPIRAEAKMFDVAAQWIVQRFSRDDAMETFRVAGAPA